MTIQYDQAMADVARELGLDRLPQEKREELLVQMGELLMKRIFVETMKRIGEENLDEYEKFMETEPGQEEAEKFFVDRIPGYDEMVVKIVEDFKAEMKEGLV
jgi:hypothetical protein